MNKKLIISLAIGSVWVIQRIKTIIEQLKITIQSVSLQHVNFTTEISADILFNVLFVNPTLIGIKLNNIKGDIYFNDRLIGYINNNYDYYVKGGANHILQTVVHVDAAQSAEAIVTNIKSGDVNNGSLQFIGSVSVGSIIPITININKTLTYQNLR